LNIDQTEEKRQTLALDEATKSFKQALEGLETDTIVRKQSLSSHQLRGMPSTVLELQELKVIA